MDQPTLRQLLKIRSELKKFLPSKAFKGLWIYQGKNNVFEVGIPKSIKFPTGFTWRGFAENSKTAKYEAYTSLLKSLRKGTTNE